MEHGSSTYNSPLKKPSLYLPPLFSVLVLKKAYFPFVFNERLQIDVQENWKQFFYYAKF